MTDAMAKNVMAIVQFIIIGLLGWVGLSTVQVREAVVRLETQMQEVVIRRMDTQDVIIGDHEKRLRELERR